MPIKKVEAKIINNKDAVFIKQSKREVKVSFDFRGVQHNLGQDSVTNNAYGEILFLNPHEPFKTFHPPCWSVSWDRTKVELYIDLQLNSDYSVEARIKVRIFQGINFTNANLILDEGGYETHIVPKNGVIEIQKLNESSGGVFGGCRSKFNLKFENKTAP